MKPKLRLHTKSWLESQQENKNNGKQLSAQRAQVSARTKYKLAECVTINTGDKLFAYQVSNK